MGRNDIAVVDYSGRLDMSFHIYSRKVRNVHLPIAHRRSALASCILRLGWLKRQKYQVVRARFASKYHLDSPNTPTEADLLAALAAIEIERNTFLEKIRAFERKRIREKHRGQRHPRKNDIELLYR